MTTTTDTTTSLTLGASHHDSAGALAAEAVRVDAELRAP